MVHAGVIQGDKDTMEESYGNNENVIEWFRGAKTATLSLSQDKHKNRVKRLAEQYPDECQITAENKDGSICCHVPASWVKIYRPREVSEDEKELSRVRMLEMRARKYGQEA